MYKSTNVQMYKYTNVPATIGSVTSVYNDMFFYYVSVPYPRGQVPKRALMF